MSSGKTSSGRGNQGSRGRDWPKNLLLLAGSLAALFLVLEAGTRIYWGEYGFGNFWAYKRDLFRSAYPSEFDPELGWVPRSGFSGNENVWGTQVTILENGIRSNGPESLQPIPGRSILALGDSFTFGDHVSDEETWPAFLERGLGVPVINGGVFGYGVDQTYLRMEQLADIYQPRVVIFSFIPNDIDRTQLSVRTSVTKPYYEVAGNRLVLRKDHLVRPESPLQDDLIRGVLGYSFFMDKLMLRTFRTWWLAGRMREEVAHGNGEEVVCLIFSGIGRFMEEHPDVEAFYLLVQHPPISSMEDYSLVASVLKCVDRSRINVVDTGATLLEYRRKNPENFVKLFSGYHMNRWGNRLIGEILKAALAGEPALGDQAPP